MLLTTVAVVAALAAGQASDTTLPVTKGTRLVVNNYSGNVTVTAWSRSDVQVRSTTGDEDARLLVDTGGGEVRISPDMRHGPPDIQVAISLPAWMPVAVQTNDGDIAVTGTAAPVRAVSVSGNVTVAGGAENVSLSSVEGDIRATGVRGNLDIQSVDGDVTVRDAVGGLTVSAVDGDVLLESITSPNVRASTVDGNIALAGAIAPNGAYSLKTHDGDITLRPAGAVNATVSVSTWGGEFESAEPVTITGTQSGKRFSFVLGNGSARIDLESFDGLIRIAK